MCNQDNKDLYQDVNKTLVTSCTAGTKCEYTCVSGYKYENGQCVMIYEWRIGGRKGCDRSCGLGTEYRDVQCVGSDGFSIDPSGSKCEGGRPQSSRECNNGPCITYSWQYGTRGQCSESCGRGTMKQEVICKDSNGNQVYDGYCTSSKPSEPTQPCNDGPCAPTITYSWQYGSRGQCNVACG